MDPLFYFTKTVTFFDCDAAGVMFYSRVYEYAHAALEQFFTARLPDFSYFSHEQLAFPITVSEASYSAPLRQGDIIQIGVKKVKTGNHSFEMNFSGCNLNGKEVFFVRTVHVCISKETGKKTELPEELKTL